MLTPMSDAPSPEIDPRRVRIGLAMLAVVVLVALAIFLLVDNGVARVLMGAIVVFGVLRTFVLLRAARAGRLNS
jgi:predicted lysophospholipase L1 biosynthesis ABC-type transport system permease subunit